MRGPTSITSDNQTVKISKESDPLSARSIPLSEIKQALSDHYQKNSGELSQNRDFSFTYKYEPNGVDYKLKVTSKESSQSESRALDREGKKIPISIETIKAQANEFEEKKQKIKNAVIDFFLKNPNEPLDSNDKKIVFNSTDNTIQTQSNTYQLSESEQQITISKNTKSEIAEKKQIRLTTINYFTENSNESMDDDFYYDKYSGSIKKENQSQSDNQFKQISISDADKKEIEEIRKIRKIAIDFFLKNPNEPLDSKDKKVVYIKASNEIKTMPQEYQIPESEQLITISENIKYEITQKRLEIDRERISLLESENRNLAPTNSSLRIELKASQDQSEEDRAVISRLESEKEKLIESNSDLQTKLITLQEQSEGDRAVISRLESEKNKSTESLDKFLQKLEEALGIKMTKSSEYESLSVATAWLPDPDSQSLPTTPDSNNKASSWLPSATSFDDRLVNCLQAAEELAQKLSETTSREKYNEKLINLLCIIEKNIPQQQESKIELTNLQERIDNASNYLKSPLSSSSLGSLSSSSESISGIKNESTERLKNLSLQVTECENSLSSINNSFASESQFSRIANISTLAPKDNIESGLQLVESTKGAKTLITTRSASALEAIENLSR